MLLTANLRNANTWWDRQSVISCTVKTLSCCLNKHLDFQALAKPYFLTIPDLCCYIPHFAFTTEVRAGGLHLFPHSMQVLISTLQYVYFVWMCCLHCAILHVTLSHATARSKIIFFHLLKVCSLIRLTFWSSWSFLQNLKYTFSSFFFFFLMLHLCLE